MTKRSAFLFVCLISTSAASAGDFYFAMGGFQRYWPMKKQDVPREADAFQRVIDRELKFIEQISKRPERGYVHIQSRWYAHETTSFKAITLTSDIPAVLASLEDPETREIKFKIIGNEFMVNDRHDPESTRFLARSLKLHLSLEDGSVREWNLTEHLKFQRDQMGKGVLTLSQRLYDEIEAAGLDAPVALFLDGYDAKKDRQWDADFEFESGAEFLSMVMPSNCESVLKRD